MPLAILVDGSWDPYGVLQPLPNPITEVIGYVLFHVKEGGLGIPGGVPMLVADCMLIRCAICSRDGQGGSEHLHELRVCGGAFIIPLKGMNSMNGSCLAQWARQLSSEGNWQ